MKKAAKTVFLMLMGLILAGYAVLAPLLGIIGTRTTGMITDVRRQGGERNEMTRNQYNYGVGFHFFLPDGRKIQGGATVVGKSYSAGIAKGPTKIRYLRQFPRIHILEKDTRFTVGNIILLGVGATLIYFSIKRGRA